MSNKAKKINFSAAESPPVCKWRSENCFIAPPPFEESSQAHVGFLVVLTKTNGKAQDDEEDFASERPQK